MNIGFIGLGNMGGPMAANLAAAGHRVTGFDPSGVLPEGVTAADDAKAAVADTDVVILMLPNGAIVAEATAEVLPAMQSGAVLVDCSTIDVETTRRLAARAEAAGIATLDAPVSGGTTGAAKGTLTFMIGGDAAAFETTRPLFDIMGQKAVFCGPAGAGQAAKICNNMILGVTMAATCEAFGLADRLGLDRQSLFDVVSTSSGASWSMNTYCPAPGVGPASPADDGYRPGFAAELMLKDLRLGQEAAQVSGVETPMGRTACDLYTAFVDQAEGRGRDFSALIRRYEDQSA
ncbi:3-hydroxyisobutyrate dehydrogenase [Marinovum sp.]|uniref:3-hydroxyisobutyrate dehydrogenase n=1 Tax=Marinovum sp. TaxID=2024839 RepID=UPI002B26F38F|nr:3-hydroxyisobutyrate dehydrogenase [Marinovum sp.]